MFLCLSRSLIAGMRAARGTTRAATARRAAASKSTASASRLVSICGVRSESLYTLRAVAYSTVQRSLCEPAAPAAAAAAAAARACTAPLCSLYQPSATSLPPHPLQASCAATTASAWTARTMRAARHARRSSHRRCALGTLLTRSRGSARGAAGSTDSRLCWMHFGPLAAVLGTSPLLGTSSKGRQS